MQLWVSSGQPSGAWITLPGGSLEVDPSSNIDRIGSSEWISYDRAFNRWILASWNHVSPDGRRSVVQGENGSFNIVDVATGAYRNVSVPQAHGQWIVLDYTTGGIYLTLMAALDYADPGLWLLNPDSGQVRKLDGTQFWSHVDSRAAWGVKSGSGSLELRRLDLQSGTLTTYLTVPLHTPLQPGDRSMELISLDSNGRPLVLLRDWQAPFPWRMEVVDAPNVAHAIAIPDQWVAGWPIVDNGDPFQSWREIRGVLLTNGIWMFGSHSFSGLAVLGPDGVLKQVSTAPDNIAAIAGGCH